MGALAGPTNIGTNGQVTVPKQILSAMGWAAQDMVMFRISDEDPETLMIVPVSVVDRRFARGEAAERMMRMTRTEPSVKSHPDA